LRVKLRADVSFSFTLSFLFCPRTKQQRGVPLFTVRATLSLMRRSPSPLPLFPPLLHLPSPSRRTAGGTGGGVGRPGRSAHRRNECCKIRPTMLFFSPPLICVPKALRGEGEPLGRRAAAIVYHYRFSSASPYSRSTRRRTLSRDVRCEVGDVTTRQE